MFAYATHTIRYKVRLLTAAWRNGDTLNLLKCGFSASYDSFVVGSSAVLQLNFCAKFNFCAF